LPAFFLLPESQVPVFHNLMKKIRIKDIASIANVSIGTVDRVLHNRGEVSETTRNRIRKLLEEYNYEPDPVASSLALKKHVSIAVVMPGSVNGHVFWDFPRYGLEKAIAELATDKLTVKQFLFDQLDKTRFSRLIDEFSYGDYQGVLFAPVFQKESQDFIRRCREAGISVVLFNSMVEEPGISSFVGQDALHSGRVAAGLINLGLEHRRDVAIINMSSRKDHYAHLIRREQGFREYFEQRSDRLDNLVTIDLNGAEDARLQKELGSLFSGYRIGGLFVTNSRVYKVAEYLAEKGAMSVRLVGYDLLPESIRYLKRDYIDFLISQNPEEQAYKGLISLFNLLAFHRNPPEWQLMPIDIITRENLLYYEPKHEHDHEKPTIGEPEK